MNIQKKRICELTIEDVECMEKYYLIPETISEEYNAEMFNECSMHLLLILDQRENQFHDLINMCVNNSKFNTILYVTINEMIIHSEIKYLFYLYVKDEHSFNQNTQSKPPIYKLISEIMKQWKNDHLQNICKVILHSTNDNKHNTFIHYTENWLVKSKAKIKPKAKAKAKSKAKANSTPNASQQTEIQQHPYSKFLS